MGLARDYHVHVILLNPAHALHGGVSYLAFVLLSVHVCLCVR